MASGRASLSSIWKLLLVVLLLAPANPIRSVLLNTGNLTSQTHLHKKRTFTKRPTAYYDNHTSTFNIGLLRCHGDVHPQPGPPTHTGISVANRRDAHSLQNPTGLSVFYANARSIVNESDLLHLETTNKRLDIIAFTETHLDNSIADAEIFPANYTVFTRDRRIRGRSGGGVAIATLNTTNE